MSLCSLILPLPPVALVPSLAFAAKSRSTVSCPKNITLNKRPSAADPFPAHSSVLTGHALEVESLNRDRIAFEVRSVLQPHRALDLAGKLVSYAGPTLTPGLSS
jgi:hypothetical protein